MNDLSAVRRPQGRPKGSATRREGCSLECRLRAKSIYQESLGAALPKDIAAQLKEEGYVPFPTAHDVSAWKRSNAWDEPVHLPIAQRLSEDIRQAIQLRVPDDLDRVERSSIVLEALTQQCATWMAKQVKNVKIETAADFEIMTRCVGELMKTHLLVGKSLQDLRQLRLSSLAGFGEVIPPEKKDRSDPPPIVGEQERVISNFGA